jgi:hypothetical protein
VTERFVPYRLRAAACCRTASHGSASAVSTRPRIGTLCLVLLDENFDATAINEAPRAKVLEALSEPGSRARNGRGALAVTKFKAMGKLTTSSAILTSKKMKTATTFPRWPLVFRRDVCATPYHTLPCHTEPRLTAPSLSVPYRTTPWPAMPRPAEPHRGSPCLTRP